MAKPQSTSHHKKAHRVRDELIYDTIIEMVRASPGKAIKPENVARSLREREWQGLLKRIRMFVSKLAIDGYINILRKGDIADPEDFKGVYRIVAADGIGRYVARMPEN